MATNATALTQSGSGQAPGSTKSGRPSRTDQNRAKLEVHEYSPGGTSVLGKPIETIAFQFNPKEVSIDKSARWDRKPTKGKKAGSVDFIGAEPVKLKLEMFFDATGQSDGSVVEPVESLLRCCTPTDASAGKKKPTPPLVVLHWGSVAGFPAFITSVNARYTLFTKEGRPIRAVCSVSMEEMPPAPKRQNPTSGGSAVQRSHTMIDGDTLASVAYGEYGEPGMWRPLAAFNHVDDPMRCRAGTVLLLPPPDELG